MAPSPERDCIVWQPVIEILEGVGLHLSDHLAQMPSTTTVSAATRQDGLIVLGSLRNRAAIRRRRQSMKRQVEVKSMNHRLAADCAPCRRRH